MSDYKVVKITDCPNYCDNGTEYTETEARRCSHCEGGKTRVEVDLEDAVTDLLQCRSTLATIISQTLVQEIRNDSLNNRQ